MSNLKTHRLTLIAMLSAISFILSYPMFKFSIIPSANFLEIDFTILPILLGLFIFDLKSSFIILVNRSLLWIIFNMHGVNDYIGLPMNILAISVYILIFWRILHKEFSLKRYIFSAILGTLALTGTMIFINYVYAIPLYSEFANFDIAQVFPGGIAAYINFVIIFNLIEGIIFAIAFFLIYKFIIKNKVMQGYFKL